MSRKLLRQRPHVPFSCFRTRPLAFLSRLVDRSLYQLFVTCRFILNAQPASLRRFSVLLPSNQLREAAVHFRGLDVAVSIMFHVLLNEELAGARLARDQEIVARDCGRDQWIVAGVN